MKAKIKPNSFKKKQNRNVAQTRKEIRKQNRKIKKQKRLEYYTKRTKQGKFVLRPQDDEDQPKTNVTQHKMKQTVVKIKGKEIDRSKEIQNDKQKQLKLEREMQKQRNKQLLKANLEEDRNIRQLEKQLKLNKRKSKSIPKSFVSEGLDYVLEVCDERNMESVVAAEKEFNDVNDDFDEDFALMTGNTVNERHEGKHKRICDSDEYSEEMDDGLSDILEDGASDCENIEEDDFSGQEEEVSSQEEGFSSEEEEFSEQEEVTNKKKKVKFVEEIGSDFSDENISDCSPEDSIEEKEITVDKNGIWEDIYGRKRTRDGAVVSNTERQKYIPPAMRAKLEEGFEETAERRQKIARLKRQLKGLLNRLAEANLHNISNQVEDLYMKNSRNDMNETMTALMLESLATHVTTPERLLLEHVVLVSILHANVGTEVGAHFLQSVIKRFDTLFESYTEVEDKTLDNIVHVIAQLYNFKVFHSKLLYDILGKLSQRFDEKSVECILLILKGVGFSLRKDDPLALKSLILDIQKKATNSSEQSTDNPRVKFMLDILLAIKNNNVTKIPNYDTSYAEHLKKITKGLMRKGNYVTQLNISLEDLLKADTRGKWWIVGSAWTGNIENQTTKEPKEHPKSDFSQKLLDLAKKQRMSTEIRRNIFCIIMSAEDYMDAFEKLLRLGLKNRQEQEIIHVLMHCCLQEKTFNPYYAVLAQKLCDYDRKFQMTVKYSVWDKLKALTECSAGQLSNLAKMLTHLFLQKGLPISTLKIVQFSELDKLRLRFVRQILLGILSCEETPTCLAVFEKVSQSEKLKMLRESLRLFIHHFLLKNLSADADGQGILRERAQLIDKMLMDKKIRF